MKRLTVIRHGETTANKEGVHSGWINPRLTEKGIEDAKAKKTILESYMSDLVFTSDLERTKETLDVLYNGRPYTHVEIAGLRELYYGEMEGQEENKDYSRHLHKGIYNNQSFKENEAMTDFYQRLFFSLHEIIHNMYCYEANDAFVVAHHGVVVALLAYLEGLPFDSLWEKKIENLGGFTFLFDYDHIVKKVKVIEVERI